MAVLLRTRHTIWPTGRSRQCRYVLFTLTECMPRKPRVSGSPSNGMPAQVPLLPEPKPLSGYSAIQQSIRIWLENFDLVQLHQASAKPSEARSAWLRDLSHLASSTLSHCSLVGYHSLLQKVESMSYALASSDIISIQFVSFVSSAAANDLVLALKDRAGFDFVVTMISAGITVLECLIESWKGTPSPGLSSLLGEVCSLIH